MLAAPPAVVPATRMVLAPAVSGAEMDAVDQVSQFAVVGKFSVPREVPLTEMVAGRAALVPSEYRKVSVLVPAAATVTGMSTYAPAALAVFAKPVPVKPEWLESKVPPADNVPVSASNVLPAGGVVGGVPPMLAPRVSRAFCTIPWALAFRFELVPFTIHDEPEKPFTVADLAAIAGMSVRSLQEGFRRHLGCTPMAYLQQERLLRAHETLRRADPLRITVAAIAHRWGFAHLGRFASAYRARFGEPPSDTLRRCG